MIFQEWDWDKAKEIWQREARAEGRAEGRAERDLAWEAVVADVVAEKNASLAEKDSEIAKLKSQLNIPQ